MRATQPTPFKKSRWLSALPCAALLGLSALSAPAVAGKKLMIDDTRWLSVGAGLRAAFTSAEDAAPNGTDDSKNFDVQSIRLYLAGQVHENIRFTFNTEEIDGDIDVLDAIAQFEFSPGFNVWAGRMLTPADRIEMNGPYYALSWNQYTQPLYPSDQGGEAGRIGRDEGLTVWGALGKFQYAVGVFDGLQGGANQDDSLLYAARFAYNFLNKEDNPGYYTSSTYYGGLGNILTLGVSAQQQSNGVGNATEAGDFSGFTVDLLSETVMGNAGVLTIEAEYKSFESDYTVATQPAGGNCFCLFDGDSSFATVAWLFPQQYGIGKLQPYVRFVQNDPSDGEASDLTELGLNYVINGHNTRLNLNYSSGDANISGYQGADTDVISVGLQLQL